MEKWNTRTVAELVGIRPNSLLTSIWNRRCPEPPRREDGRTFDWTEEAVRAVCRSLAGKSLEECQARMDLHRAQRKLLAGDTTPGGR